MRSPSTRHDCNTPHRAGGARITLPVRLIVVVMVTTAVAACDEDVEGPTSAAGVGGQAAGGGEAIGGTAGNGGVEIGGRGGTSGGGSDVGGGDVGGGGRLA